MNMSTDAYNEKKEAQDHLRQCTSAVETRRVKLIEAALTFRRLNDEKDTITIKAAEDILCREALLYAQKVIAFEEAEDWVAESS